MLHGSPMPQAVVANGFVFLSAIRGVEETSDQLVDDAGRQARRAFDIAEEVLALVGSRREDIVRVGIYMTDLQEDRPAFNQVWTERFGDAGPARFAVEVSDIGRPGDSTRLLLDVIALAPSEPAPPPGPLR